MSYTAAKDLSLYNSNMGRIVEHKDIAKDYAKAIDVYNGTIDKITAIKDKSRHIINAEPILDKYLKDKAALEKLQNALLKFGKGYKEKLKGAQENFSYSEGRYKDYQGYVGEKFSSKIEFEDIKNRHGVEVDKIPDMHKQLEVMEPELKLLGGISKAINGSISEHKHGKSLEQAIENARQNIASRDVSPGKGRGKDRDDDQQELDFDRGRGR